MEILRNGGRNDIWRPFHAWHCAGLATPSRDADTTWALNPDSNAGQTAVGWQCGRSLPRRGARYSPRVVIHSALCQGHWQCAPDHPQSFGYRSEGGSRDLERARIDAGRDATSHPNSRARGVNTLPPSASLSLGPEAFALCLSGRLGLAIAHSSFANWNAPIPVRTAGSIRQYFV